MKKAFAAAVLLFSFMLSACNQPFDPRGSLDQRLVVFSVLSTDRSLQIVRVERNYLPVDFDPLTYTADNSIVGATVALKSGSLTYLLRDTTFPRSDTSRYKSPLHGYVLNPFKPEYGKLYSIDVESADYGIASGSVLVPSRPFLSLQASTEYVLDYPGSSPEEDYASFQIVCGNGSRAFIGRLFIVYDVQKDGAWVEERAEIPVSYKYSGLRDFRYVLYASITRAPLNNHAVVAYRNELYRRMVSSIAFEKYSSTKIIFDRIVYQFLQFDLNLYNYYLVAHAFDDPHSTRLDEPVYSNVLGGQGVVGAYTLDSLVHPLPENFGFNRR